MAPGNGGARRLLNSDRCLELLFNEHRVVWFKDSEGRRTLDRSAARIGLGFEKLSLAVDQAGSLADKVVMNIFSGPGGLVRLCSILPCRMVIGIDVLYGPSSVSRLNYDVDHQFSLWKDSLGDRYSYRDPLFLKKDVTVDHLREFASAVDVLFVDPPFGRETKNWLNIDERSAKRVFLDALKRSAIILRPGGALVVLVPSTWRSLAEHLLRKIYNLQVNWLSLGGSGTVLMGKLERP